MATVGTIFVALVVTSTAAIDASITTSAAPPTVLQEDDICDVPNGPACGMNALQRGSAAPGRRATAAHDQIEAPCVIKKGNYYVGTPAGWGTARSPSLCANMCAQKQGCKVFNFKDSTGSCSFVETIQSTMAHSAYTSGTPCTKTDCAWDTNFFINGNGYKTVTVPSVADCADQCFKATYCKAWDFYTPQSTCYMKSSVGQSREYNYYTAGFPCEKKEVAPPPAIPSPPVQSPPQVPPTVCDPSSFKTGTWTYGKQLGSVRIALSPEDCAKQCYKASGCVAWTMSTTFCSLKSSVIKQQPHGGYSSGLPCKPASCAIKENVWLSGRQLGRHTDIASAQSCADICSKANGCRGWSYSDRYKICFTKGTLNQVRMMSGYSSGTPC